MQELEKIDRVTRREAPDRSHEVFLVIDATIGQNAMEQARVFSQVIAVTGLVLTKLDSTAKGGVAVAISAQLGVPIRFIGIGEGIEDLLPFDPAAYASAIAGI
jgi:fused signal recognition particle receptor